MKGKLKIADCRLQIVEVALSLRERATRPIANCKAEERLLFNLKSAI